MRTLRISSVSPPPRNQNLKFPSVFSTELSITLPMTPIFTLCIARYWTCLTCLYILRTCRHCRTPWSKIIFPSPLGPSQTTRTMKLKSCFPLRTLVMSIIFKVRRIKAPRPNIMKPTPTSLLLELHTLLPAGLVAIGVGTPEKIYTPLLNSRFKPAK